MRGRLSSLWLLAKEMLQAYGLCEQALRIDKDNVRALVILALRHLELVYNMRSVDPQAERLRADELISRALSVDSNNYLAHFARSFFLAPQRPDEAILEAERALALNPSFIPAYISLWIANWTPGRTEKADEYPDAALRFSPHDSLAYMYLVEKGNGLFNQSRYEAATEFFKRAIAVAPEAVMPSFKLAASLALSGHDAAAREALRRYLALPLDVPKTMAQFKKRQPFDSPSLHSYYDRLYEGLRKAGLPEE